MPTSTHRATATWTRRYDRDGTETAAYRSSETRPDARGGWEVTRRSPDGAVESVRRLAGDGRVLEERTFDREGREGVRELYLYDEAGRETERVLQLRDGSTHGRWKSRYDPSGRLVERVWYGRNGASEVTETFTYDAAGRLVRRVRGNVAAWTYDYDEAGHRVRSRGGYFSGDDPTDGRCEYDAQGRLERRTRYYASGGVASVTTYQYGEAGEGER